MRILIVDDEEENVLLLSRILGRMDDVVTVTTTDATRANELFEQHRPDLVLLDLHLGNLDGVEVMKGLTARTAADDFVPIVVLTADIDPTVRMRALEAGAHDFLTKPLDFSEVLLRIRNLLRTRTLHLRLEEQRAALTRQVRAHDREDRVEGERRKLASERIQSVLERQAISIAFQPIADLRGGRVVGIEALARFEDEPRRSPDKWFAAAREVGLGRDLELAALRIALEQLPAIPEELWISINASPAYLADCVEDPVLADHWGERVVVELTEHARVDDYDDLLASVATLRSLGVRLAVDDAGAGFSSLQHILRLGPDLIKLDMSLTRNIDADPIRRALAASLVTFASEVGAQMVAEGIETSLEQRALTSLGVTMGQGFYLARPGPLPVPTRLTPSFTIEPGSG